MLKIEVIVSTNASEEEAEKLSIESDAISSFTGEGYADNTYDAKVIFSCMPRAINPDIMQIFLELKDIGEAVLAWGTICSAIVKFARECHGYKKSVILKKNDKNVTSLQLDDNMTADELEDKIKQELNKK